MSRISSQTDSSNKHNMYHCLDPSKCECKGNSSSGDYAGKLRASAEHRGEAEGNYKGASVQATAASGNTSTEVAAVSTDTSTWLAAARRRVSEQVATVSTNANTQVAVAARASANTLRNIEFKCEQPDNRNSIKHN